ncbi:uncharacterized protein LOC129591681 [Paramacrobiotus metropolitanus]|uniref:uncharacterized protein LOC129591681 n=1 Tax=Paramacrobiotus metropolitanus TaxID=2943436 RepID=UPI002445D60A|nr:uncharacterized protein LOC129591681 [Paramacrobiotus metropolitanus]
MNSAPQELYGLAGVSHYMTRIVLLCKPQNLSSPLSSDKISTLENGIAQFITEFSAISGSIRETHKTYLETAIRGCFWDELNQTRNFLDMEWLMRCTVDFVDADILDPAVPFMLFQEACDWGDSREKEQIANLFVDLKNKWRSPKFVSSSCKNMLLRFAVELLSRLPKTTSGKARGRLLCYVSARIPMSDKGAANIAGEFNTGKCVTTEGLTTGTANNPHANAKFAQLCNLLDCLKNPNLVLTDKGFATFKQGMETVLEMMTPTDLKEGEQEEGEVEDGRSRILTRASRTNAATGSVDVNLNSIRFNPDPNALESDMKQDRVKRNLLCRFLFVAQYICLPSRPKGPVEPTEDQLVWCDKKVQTALEILSRTNPDGPLYVQRLLDHLDSEATVSIWKDNQCPTLQTAPKADLSSLSPYPPRDKLPYPKVSRVQFGKEKLVNRKSIRDMPLAGPGKVTGSVEVTRLLNKGPNTMEEFQNLGYQPPDLSYFAPVVEQAITKETPKIVNDEKFQWRALRILGKRTHIHFSNEAAVEKMPTKDMGTFLENYVMQLAEKNPDLQSIKQTYLAATATSPVEMSPNNAEENGNVDMAADNLDDLINPVPDEDLPAEEEPEPAGHQIMNKESILGIAKLIGADWERFAGILQFDPDSISYWKSSSDDPVQQAALMLQVYMEQHSQPDSDSNDALEKLLGVLKDEYAIVL